MDRCEQSLCEQGLLQGWSEQRYDHMCLHARGLRSNQSYTVCSIALEDMRGLSGSAMEPLRLMSPVVFPTLSQVKPSVELGF